MKKILIVIPSLEIGGGAEKNAYLLGKSLSKDYEVRYVTFYNANNYYKTDLYTYHFGENINKNRIEKFLIFFKRIIFLRKIMKEFKPNIIISFLFIFDFVSILSKIGLKTKIIVSVRNSFFYKSKYYRFFIKLLYPYADVIHVISKEMLKEAKEMGLKKIKLIYNIHNIDEYKKLSTQSIPMKKEKKEKIIINIGRCTHQKGQWHLIKAFKVVTEKKEDVKLFLIGEGSLKNNLKDLVKKLNLEGKVIFIPKTNNVFPYIQISDIFVLTSLKEGLPNVLIETLSLEKSIISTDCKTGVRDILAPELYIDTYIKYPYKGKCGILIDNWDNNDIDFSTNITIQEKKLAFTIIENLKNKNYMIKEKCYQRFNKDVIIDEWIKLLKEI